jgi:small subunit ribosomal protein S24e
MDFEFIRDERNELLNRRELGFVLTFEGPTPSRRDILGKLCALQNVDETLVVLDSLKTKFGKQELVGDARIYDDEETKLRLEPEHLQKRGVTEQEEEGES